MRPIMNAWMKNTFIDVWLWLFGLACSSKMAIPVAWGVLGSMITRLRCIGTILLIITVKTVILDKKYIIELDV